MQFHIDYYVSGSGKLRDMLKGHYYYSRWLRGVSQWQGCHFVLFLKVLYLKNYSFILFSGVGPKWFFKNNFLTKRGQSGN